MPSFNLRQHLKAGSVGGVSLHWEQILHLWTLSKIFKRKHTLSEKIGLFLNNDYCCMLVPSGSERDEISMSYTVQIFLKVLLVKIIFRTYKL